MMISVSTWSPQPFGKADCSFMLVSILFVSTKVWKLLPWSALMVRMCKCSYWVSPRYSVVIASLLCRQTLRPWEAMGIWALCRIWKWPSMNQFLCIPFFHTALAQGRLFPNEQNEKESLKLHHCWKATTGQDKKLAPSTLWWVLIAFQCLSQYYYLK